MLNIDELLPTANEIRKQSALKEAEKAEEQMSRMAAAEAEKQALIDELSKPSGLSEDEKVKRASTVIQRAVRNGLHEVQVYRFPNALCTDRGRAINQMEARLGKHAYRNAQGDLSPLEGLPAAARLQDRVSDHRLPWRGARRYRHHAELVMRPARLAFRVIGQEDVYLFTYSSDRAG